MANEQSTIVSIKDPAGDMLAACASNRAAQTILCAHAMKHWNDATNGKRPASRQGVIDNYFTGGNQGTLSMVSAPGSRIFAVVKAPFYTDARADAMSSKLGKGKTQGKPRGRNLAGSR